ncbi:MAG: methionyl-tRNA formyltransferase [Chloroflexota bacterium]|nr:methionyl-tRNA formyltransferase [Chloroflexota bacterium]
MRVVFFGTPAFAVPTLRRLAHDSQFEVALVVSRPDRPAGRGQRLAASPVTEAATDLGLRCYQPPNLRDPDARAPLRAVAADLFVVAAYGLIFGPKTLALPRLGCVNVHASLLPRYRGASPIAAAILNGDDETGVTLMLMEAGLDTGPIIGSRREPISAVDTTEALTRRLAEAGAELAASELPRFVAGEIQPTAQPTTGVTLTRPLSKADGWLDWTLPARLLDRSVRAFWPWPRAWTTLDGQTVQVHQAEAVPMSRPPAPGTVMADRSELLVACGADALRLTKVQLAGGKPLGAVEFLAGRRDDVHVLGTTNRPAPQPPLIVAVDQERDQ